MRRPPISEKRLATGHVQGGATAARAARNLYKEAIRLFPDEKDRL